MMEKLSEDKFKSRSMQTYLTALSAFNLELVFNLRVQQKFNNCDS